MVSGSTSLGKSICHNVVSSDLVPVRIVVLSWVTSILSRVIVAVQPASHNCPTDNKLCVVISGTMCANVADGGSVGMSRCPSCVDVIILPSGIAIRIGIFDSVMCTRLLFGVDKCVVHPVSMIVGMLLCEGGLKTVVDVNAFVIFFTSSVLVLSSPRRQSVLSVFGAFLFLPILNSQQPSIMSIHVASF